MENNFENIPKRMKEEAFFCLHKNKKPLKTNHYYLRPNTKEDFSSYDSVIKARRNDEGIGIGLFDSYCGIDIDHCLNGNEPSELAKDIVKTIKSYTEKSLSGTGIHIIFKCDNQEKIDSIKYYTKMNEDQLKKNGFTGTGGLEIYQGNFDNRYLTLTGNLASNTYKDIVTIDFSVIKGIIEKYMKRPEMTSNNTIRQDSTFSAPTEDKQFLEIGLQKDDKLIELWNSTPSGSGGNESETDQALMNKLAYWCNGNETLMIESFESSPFFMGKDDLHLKKWNQREDYKEKTIQNAIRTLDSTAKQDNQDYIQRQREKEVQGQLNKEGTEKKVEEIELDSLSAYNNIDSFFEKTAQGTFKPISTGFKNLDEALEGGFSNQSLVILGGASSMGKTTLAINLAIELLKKRPIIYYTLENSTEQILSKFFSYLCYKEGGMKIKSNNFLKSYDENIMTKYQKEQVIKCLKEQSYLDNLFVINPETATIEELEKTIYKINDKCKEQGKESPCLILDYLQFLQSTNSRDDEMQIAKKTSRIMKKYVIETNSIGFLIVANNRGSNQEKQTKLDSGRGTSDIEYSSDYNLQLNFSEWEHNPNSKKTATELKQQNPREMSVTIQKQRFGQSGTIVDFIFNGISNSFEEKGLKTIPEVDSFFQKKKESTLNKLSDM